MTVSAHRDSTSPNTSEDSYVVGVDFGTLSGRALVVRVSDGAELGSAVCQYPHGVMDAKLAATGDPLPPDWALQDPEDYREVLRQAVPAAVQAAGIDPARVIGIGTDFTACTVLPVLRDGTPLCHLPGLAGRPHAYVKLWKHHAAQPQADRINALAHERGEPWIARYGGKISSEWQFAKALQLLEEDPEIYDRAERWIEAADWIIWQLVRHRDPQRLHRRVQGHLPGRALPVAGLPGRAEPAVRRLRRGQAGPPGQPARRPGRLADRRGGRLDRPAGRHRGRGGQRGRARHPARRQRHRARPDGGHHGHVNLSRDERQHAWPRCPACAGWSTAASWPVSSATRPGRAASATSSPGTSITGCPRPTGTRRPAAASRCSTCWPSEAAGQPAGAHGLIALDWQNGNRSVLVDHHLSGVIVGLTLATRPPDIYRALVEATAFGTRVIIDTFAASGVPVTEFVVAGGLLKDSFVMQVYADVLRRPLSVIVSEQGPALGSAIHAAVAAGSYPDVPAAAAAMGGKRADVYTPDPASADVYDELYAEYTRLHDYFGRGGNEVMHRLRALRDRVLAAEPARQQAYATDHDHAEEGDSALSGGDVSEHAISAAISHTRAEVYARCTPRWSRTTWSPGPRATCPRGCPAPT